MTSITASHLTSFSFFRETAKDPKQQALETVKNLSTATSCSPKPFNENVTLQVRDQTKKIQAKLSTLWQRIFSKNTKGGNHFNHTDSILHLFPENPLPLPSDCVPLVLQNLEYTDLINFALVNSSAIGFANLALKAKAKQLGYKGADISQAKAYLAMISSDLGILAQRGATALKKHIVYNSKMQISIERSIRNLQKLPIQDLLAIFHQAPLSPSNFLGNRLSSSFKGVLFLNYPIQESQINPINNHLALAIRQGNQTLIDLLLCIGANPNAGEKPLLYEAVVKPNQQEMIKLLLSRASHQQIVEALLRLIPLPYVENLTAVLEHGVDLKSTFGTSACTLLHYAAVHGEPETIRLLVKHGADVNQLDAHGQSPLAYAQNKGYEENIQALLEVGAIPC